MESSTTRMSSKEFEDAIDLLDWSNIFGKGEIPTVVTGVS